MSKHFKRRIDGKYYDYLGTYHWMEADAVVRSLRKDFSVRTEVDKKNEDKVHVYARNKG